MKQLKKPLPTLFFGHGSPMNAIETNDFTKTLNKLGSQIEKPTAILCISAHWYTDGTKIYSGKSPKTIHDFVGFPDELYEITYPAEGAPELAKRVHTLLGNDTAQLTNDWGLDHGTWSILRHVYPKASIPTIQLSLDYNKSPKEHFQLAERLKPLRDEGILIIGSGNIVHNLGRLIWDENAPVYPWSIEFDDQVKLALNKRDIEPLINYKTPNPQAAQLAVPTPDHYLPLLYTLAVSDAKENPSYPYEGIQNGSISMRTVRWG